jgi:2,3-diaminopropionate biosynthesis protein SbnB
METRADRLRLLTGAEVDALLAGRECEILRRVRLAYEAHANGQVELPKSVFLRLPGDGRNRIIALPAYLADDCDGLAGIKWISSVPMNCGVGLDRASAVVVLNSPSTGRPIAVMEGSIISAKRTAASAVLAARTLLKGRSPSAIGVIGCGAINFEILRFLGTAIHGFKSIHVFDTRQDQSSWFRNIFSRMLPGMAVVCAPDAETVFGNASLVSIATTATQPHLFSLPCSPGTVVLHVSLRDIAPQSLQSCINVVDDIDHVCQHQTSLHLLEGITGKREFIRCTLGDLLVGRVSLSEESSSVKVFSPFGMGICDLAVARLAYEAALSREAGTETESFFPVGWMERAERIATAALSTSTA